MMGGSWGGVGQFFKKLADDHHDGDDDNGDDIDNEDNDTDGDEDDDDGDKDDDDNDASQPALVLFFLLCAFCKEISLGTRHQTNHDDDDNGEKIMRGLLNKKSPGQNPVWRPVWSGLPSHLADDVGQRHDVVLRQGQRLDLRQLPGLMHMGDYLPEVLMECR